MIYIAITIRFTSTLILLDSESSNLAEDIYYHEFKEEVSTLDAAMRLAVDGHQPPNVRFYSSCLIADMLVTNGEKVATSVLNGVGNAPIINTQFFGGNRLTSKFYTPGHDQAHVYPREVIQERLRDLRSGSQ